MQVGAHLQDKSSEDSEHEPVTPPRPRSASDLDWDGMQPTSPANTRDAKKRKQVRRRLLTLGEQRKEKEEAATAQGLASVEANIALGEQEESTKTARKLTCYRNVMAHLKAADATWGDFVEWISDPRSGCKHVHFEGLFKNRHQVSHILDLWAKKNSRTGRTILREWTIEYTARLVSQEAEVVTQEGVLQSRRMPMTDSFILSFSLSSIHARICMLCPTMSTVLAAFSTTQRQKNLDGEPPTTDQELQTREQR